jgi:ABC-type nitrate/sulfonate/bicarbonate transport system substrate-binding protein
MGFLGWSNAQSGPKIRIGYWPIAAGLPFYAAIELGYFKEAGLNVEVQRYAGAQQIMEGMLSDRTDGSANGTGSANIAIGELAAPGTFKIICSNPSNVKNVLDEMLVPANSTAKTMADLKGKRVGSGPGIQNVTLAKTILERGGATGATVVELPISQHVAALAAPQAAARRVGARKQIPSGTDAPRFSDGRTAAAQMPRHAPRHPRCVAVQVDDHERRMRRSALGRNN